jgi:hypothetical protein
LVRVLRYLKTLARFLPIPFSEADDAGFKVPCSSAPLKFNHEGWYRYTCIWPVSTALAVPRDRASARKCGYKDFNPHGWESAYLGGFAHNPTLPFDLDSRIDTRESERSDLISRRPFQGEVLRRRRRTKFVPFWDWFGVQDEGRFARSSFESWQALMVVTLSSDSVM